MFKTLTFVCLAVALSAARVDAQTVVNRNDIMYVMPTWNGLFGSSASVAAELANMRNRLGPEGPYVKLGFSVYVDITMEDWNVNISDPAAIRRALSVTIRDIDAFIKVARDHNFPISIMFQTALRARMDTVQTASQNEDIRSMMWYADNVLANGWWTHSRYARKQQAVQEAYVREVAKIVANRMSLYPDTLIAATGDGEQELAFARTVNIYADYSPFTVAEFRDWLRQGGQYATGQPFAGQGYSLGARYAGDATPGIDSNGDGFTLNGDFGTNFQNWNLLHFDWSLADAFQTNDPNRIAKSAYDGSGFVKLPGSTTGGFDPPRVPKALTAGDKFWDVWVLFKQTMLQRHNIEFARWMTTSVDNVTHTTTPSPTNATIPTTRWYSNQVPTDYLFNGSPTSPNDRWHSAMSSWFTADVTPYGSFGLTAFNVDFTGFIPTPFVAYTLKNVAPQIAARDLRWGITESHPGQTPDGGGLGYSTDLELYRSEMRIIEQYRPSLYHPHSWGVTGASQVEGTGSNILPFERALKEMVANLKDGLSPDPRIATDVADGASITAPRALTGSAIDLGKVRGSGSGTGIDQVTATILKSGGSPQTLTVTTGISRTDTATSHGAQFAKSGFSIAIPALAEGQYTLTISARSTVGAAATTTKTMTVTVAFPATASPAALQFGATKFGADLPLSTVTAPQVVTPIYGGNVTPTWTAVGNQSWIGIGAGPNKGQFTVSVQNPANIIGGQTNLTGVVTITSTTPPLSLTVPVTLSVVQVVPETVGAFDSPATSTTPISGSVGVSGWALNRVGVNRVEIWRDPAAGETTPTFNLPGHLGHGKILVERITTFIEGARPDIAAQYSDYPNAHKAAWGYLMLTYGLFNGGNGTFTLHAFAYDVTGRGVTLGSKTIVVSNVTSVKPFGNIDTPTNGATLSTTDNLINHWNFGWALTPNASPACTIVTASGSPLRGVFVAFDSGPLQPVTYGDLRTDIAGLFPGYTNSNGAGGAYFINLSSLTAGSHNLGWFVVDNCNRAEGIGSRFINVVKSDTLGTVENTAAALAAIPEPVAIETAPVTVRRDFTDETASSPNPEGVRIVHFKVGERVEVTLPKIELARYEGFQVVNGERRALPVGSSFDPTSETFFWTPAPGFRGSFDLEFVTVPGAVATRLRAVVGPASQLVVDAPQAGTTVSGAFTVGGWALDLAGQGTGVDAVDVWAYPVGVANAKPIFAGSAVYGGNRPDVGAIYGAAYESAGYDLMVNGLAPGTYDLVVFARSTTTGNFDASQVVRVTVR